VESGIGELTLCQLPFCQLPTFHPVGLISKTEIYRISPVANSLLVIERIPLDKQPGKQEI
jgi:hypothetical protein